MQIASWLLVTSTLAAPVEAPPPVAHMDITAADAAVAGQGRTAQPTPANQVRRRFGVGGNVTASTRQVGGDFRYWVNSQLGLQFSASWYRPRNTGGDRSSTALIAPSMIYMFKPFDPNRDVNLRPYAGGGLNYARASVPASASSQLRNESRGLGGQAFGGVELTFLDAQNISISGEVVHYWVPDNFINSDAVRGTRFQGAIFFYF